MIKTKELNNTQLMRLLSDEETSDKEKRMYENRGKIWAGIFYGKTPWRPIGLIDTRAKTLEV